MALAIVWIARAWRDVDGRCISRCFAKDGFGVEPPSVIDNQNQDLTLTDELLMEKDMAEELVFAPISTEEDIINEVMANIDTMDGPASSTNEQGLLKYVQLMKILHLS